MVLEHEHKDTYSETFFYMICRVSFSCNYRIKESTVKVCISSSLFIKENMKQDFWMMLQEQKQRNEPSSQLPVQW
jgi:hypothetical protein